MRALESTFSCGDSVEDSALGEQCGSVAKIVKGTNAKLANLPQFSQSYHSPTAIPRILEKDNQAELITLESSFACHTEPLGEVSSPNAPTPSLRGSEATEAKQGEAAASLVIHKDKAQKVDSRETAQLTHHDSRNCGGALRVFEKFRVGVTLAVMTALNFSNRANRSPKAESLKAESQKTNQRSKQWQPYKTLSNPPTP